MKHRDPLQRNEQLLDLWFKKKVGPTPVLCAGAFFFLFSRLLILKQAFHFYFIAFQYLLSSCLTDASSSFFHLPVLARTLCSVCPQLRHVRSPPLLFKHKAVSGEGAAFRPSLVFSEVMHISCLTGSVLTALLSVSALPRAVLAGPSARVPTQDWVACWSSEGES